MLREPVARIPVAASANRPKTQAGPLRCWRRRHHRDLGRDNGLNEFAVANGVHRPGSLHALGVTRGRGRERDRHSERLTLAGMQWSCEGDGESSQGAEPLSRTCRRIETDRDGLGVDRLDSPDSALDHTPGLDDRSIDLQLERCRHCVTHRLERDLAEAGAATSAVAEKFAEFQEMLAHVGLERPTNCGERERRGPDPAA